jgi:quercetin dioxygenase-like cupin family protein
VRSSDLSDSIEAKHAALNSPVHNALSTLREKRSAMKVSHGREEGKPSVRRTQTVTGEMWGDPILHDVGDVGVGDIAVNSVFFTPGSRSHWHRHDGAHVLFITQGRGFVGNADGEIASVVAGDVVFCAPGEEHWHGAAHDNFMQHTTITVGKTEWHDPVGDEQYGKAGN